MTPAPLMFALALSAFQGQQGRDSVRFYSGPVRVTHVRGTIELADGADPTVRFDIGARNPTAKPDSARIAFRGGAASRLVLNARDSALVSPAPRVRRSGKAGGAQGVTIDLALELNGLPLADAIDSIDLRIALPAGGGSLLRSSLPAEPRDTAGGRTNYHITLQRRHLTTLNLVYTTGPVSLIMNKAITPTAIDHAGPITVTLTVRNVGRGNAHGVLLEDSYDPRDFAGQGAEFSSEAGKVNDRRLIWSRQLDLAAGATTTVTYTLSALFPVQYSSLAPATASIGGELVGVSNKIWLPGKR